MSADGTLLLTPRTLISGRPLSSFELWTRGNQGKAHWNADRLFTKRASPVKGEMRANGEIGPSREPAAMPFLQGLCNFRRAHLGLCAGVAVLFRDPCLATEPSAGRGGSRSGT
jgi:hypothetical protein